MNVACLFIFASFVYRVLGCSSRLGGFAAIQRKILSEQWNQNKREIIEKQEGDHSCSKEDYI